MPESSLQPLLGTLSKLFIAIVAIIHVYILVLEMFLWKKPFGRKAFRMSEAQAEATSVLAANQGLYNGFLAAGLLWALVYPSAYFARELALFFLGCVIVAALYGAYSVGRKILYIQGIPAMVAFVTTFLVSL